MRRIDVTNSLTAKVENFAILERPRLSVREIVQRNHDADHTMRNLGRGRSSKPLIHRTAFVGFHMTKRDPAKLVYRHDFGNSIGNGSEHSPWSGMEKQRLFSFHQELVESKTVGSDVRHQRR